MHTIKLTMCSIYTTIIEMKHKSITKEIVVTYVYAYIIVYFHLSYYNDKLKIMMKNLINHPNKI